MSLPSIEIGGRPIGEAYDPWVVAEIGINHNGDLKTAMEMVDAAHRAGAEVVKFQCHIVEDEMFDAAKLTIPGNAKISIYDIMDECSLDADEEVSLKAYVEKKGMFFLSTPFSRAAANRLQDMGVAAFKIGSGECNNYPLIEHVAKFGKPMIVSTGMNSIKSVTPTVEILRKYKIPYALLHTTNIYPTPARLVRLGAMQELKAAFPDAVIGLSDHTVSNHACFAAIALGASILERHFTDSKDRVGPDIVCSMTPEEMKDLINQSKNIAAMRGGRKEAASEEQVTIDFAFASVGAIAPIRAGDVLSEKNLWVRRPGTGEIKAEHYPKLLGKKAAVDIPKGALLKWDMVA